MANSDPYRIATHEPIATKFRKIDYVRERTHQIWYKFGTNLVQIHPLGASGEVGEIVPFY